MKRTLLLVLCFALLPTATAFAETCDNCLTSSCYKSDGSEVEAPRCIAFPEPDHYGYADCRNVRNCGGCMGWTCVVQVPYDATSPAPQLILVPEKMEVVTLAAAPSDTTRNQ